MKIVDKNGSLQQWNKSEICMVKVKQCKFLANTASLDPSNKTDNYNNQKLIQTFNGQNSSCTV